ncbi:MAG: alpha/beta hydrolase [Gammaproteobacteria bacterium]
MPTTHRTVSDHTVDLAGHTMFFHAAGPEDGTPVIFAHGWPELGHSWRHLLPVLGGLGFRAIAPDLRGHGRSSVYPEQADYRMERHVGDLINLLDHLGHERAVWVGHDWGAPVIWSVASHRPERCFGVANLCVPYAVLDKGIESAIELVDRSIYPEAQYPAGQWEYQRFYEENFDRAVEVFDNNPETTIKALFRKWSPDDRGKPAITAGVRNAGGWFGGLDEAPDFPRDDDVISEADLAAYVTALKHTGFRGSCSFYMNHKRNAEYAKSAINGGRIDMPVLFLVAAYDYVCECVDSRLPEPMREKCTDLTERTVNSGHWMAQEKPVDVANALTHWMATKLPAAWPTPPLG